MRVVEADEGCWSLTGRPLGGTSRWALGGTSGDSGCFWWVALFALSRLRWNFWWALAKEIMEEAGARRTITAAHGRRKNCVT